jgi:hypothetical protein
MTDPMGRHWTQPAREAILVDTQYAMMSTAVFDRLSAYNATNPSGVYPGKMWKRAGVSKTWFLVWYGPVMDDKCMIESREILIVD